MRTRKLPDVDEVSFKAFRKLRAKHYLHRGFPSVPLRPVQERRLSSVQQSEAMIRAVRENLEKVVGLASLSPDNPHDFGRCERSRAAWLTCGGGIWD